LEGRGRRIESSRLAWATKPVSKQTNNKERKKQTKSQGKGLLATGLFYSFLINICVYGNARHVYR
jgi:hypothetical protein